MTPHEQIGEIQKRVNASVIGQERVVERLIIALLANGNVLVEGLPGLAKTRAIKSLSQALESEFSRIQFTPDLLPSDITGVSVFNQAARDFEFKPGPVFANIVIGDEINRASPKTQSALLESMEERQVSVDGATYELPDPFTVIATQNPVEMEGTYALPEAQRDRFMARISMGYPDAANEASMLRQREQGSPLDRLRPVVTISRLQRMIRTVREVYVSPAVEQYVVAIAAGTRADRELRLGASPRATLQLVRAAKARAALDGRDFVLPDDIDALAVSVLAHRLMPAKSSGGYGREALADIAARIVQATPVPLGASGTA
jgi:MoxR-like ATPase